MRTATHCHVAPRDFLNEVVVRGGSTELVGTLVGVRGDPYIVRVNGLAINVRPSRYMVMITNEDRPGVVGAVGTILGEGGCEHPRHGARPLGHLSRDTSLIVLSTDRHVEVDVAATAARRTRRSDGGRGVPRRARRFLIAGVQPGERPADDG